MLTHCLEFATYTESQAAKKEGQQANTKGYSLTMTKNAKGPKLLMFFTQLHVTFPGMKEQQMLEVHQEAFQAYQEIGFLGSFEEINTLSKQPFQK